MSDTNTPTVEQAMADNPEFAEAFANQTSGEYQHTLFEMWDRALENTIEGFKQPLSMQWCDNMLRGWPHLRYSDLPDYVALHVARLESVRDALRALYPKPAKHLYKENVGDWDKHKAAYIDAIVEITRMTNQWAIDWTQIPFYSPLKALDAISVTIANAMLMGEGNFIHQVEYLSGFEITDEEGEEIEARIAGEEVSDE